MQKTKTRKTLGQFLLENNCTLQEAKAVEAYLIALRIQPYIKELKGLKGLVNNLFQKQ